MIKRVCDRCGSENHIVECQLPVYAPKYHIMNCGKLVDVIYNNYPTMQTYDLCEECAHKVTKLLSDFMNTTSN